MQQQTAILGAPSGVSVRKAGRTTTRTAPEIDDRVRIPARTIASLWPHFLAIGALAFYLFG